VIAHVIQLRDDLPPDMVLMFGRATESKSKMQNECAPVQAWHMNFFNRIREDIDHMQTLVFSGGNEYGIAKTKKEFGELHI